MEFKLGDLCANPGEKQQGFVRIYETGFEMPVTLINGKHEGKTILITGGIHGCEYPAIQTAIELANELNPEEIAGRLMIIHPVNTSAFKQKISAFVPEDCKNLNRVFPGSREGTLSEQIAHFISTECQQQADFYLDLHGGDLYELSTNFVYYPGIAEPDIIEKSKEVAAILDVKYMVKSGATTGAYNSAAIRGIPSLLIERGGRGLWSREEIEAYKGDVQSILKYLKVLNGELQKNQSPINITKAIYLEAEVTGCWYPDVEAGQLIRKGQRLGIIKDFFGQVVRIYEAQMDGVVLYMTISLSVEENEPLVAYGEVAL